MSKKNVLFIVLFALCCLLGINNVKATEGRDQLGAKSVYCVYCNPSNKADCLDLAISTTVKGSESDYVPTYLYRYNGNQMAKIEYDNNQKQTFGPEDVVYFYYDSDFFNRDYNTTQGCPKYIHYVILDNSYLWMHGYQQIFVAGNDNSATTFTRQRLTSLNNGFWDWMDIFNFHEAEQEAPIQSYALAYMQGFDNDEPGSTQLVNKMIQIREAIKSEGIGSIAYRGGEGNCSILSAAIKEKINWALDFIKYFGTALAIILGAVDFLGAIFSDDDKTSKKAFGKFIKRLIAAVLLFLLPLLIQLLFTTIDNPLIKIPGFNVDSATCGIGTTE